MATPHMDVDAYDRCVDDHADALYRFAVKHQGDRDEAKDIVQESFLRLWQRLDQVDPARARAYLFSTAHHLIVDRSRRRKHVARFEDRHANVLTTQQPKIGVKDIIDEALATLTPIQRSLVLLRDRDGHTYQDIAAITGLDMTRVKVYLFRARRAMQAYIGDPALVA